ncbi:MAG: glycosyltransferase [Terracidiphilus sp.]|jgi:glycosyltransferase involved in cell wall biosynthesis
MLHAAGFIIDLLETNNDGIVSVYSRAKTALQVTYSFPSRKLVAERIIRFQPDLVHVHNLFPTLTPSVYDACCEAHIPVVQTLHNFRMMCANGLLFRSGKICTECLGHAFPTPAIRHGCYHGSRIGTSAVAAMISIHRARGTWKQKVNCFISLTDFARNLFINELGIQEARIVVKPNAAPDPGLGDGSGGYALYVGRLSPEKGLQVLLDAANDHEGLGLPLKIAGSGPLQESVQAACRPSQVEFLGQQGAASVRMLMRKARVLLMPSLWYEGLPMVVPEAFGAGLPIIASRIGALETLIKDQHNGLLVEPGCTSALRMAVRRIASDRHFEIELRCGARATYEAEYRPATNLRALVQIYGQVASDGKARIH